MPTEQWKTNDSMTALLPDSTLLRALTAAALVTVVDIAAAQATGSLAPTADLIVPVTGPLHYSFIAVPAGVTVSFVIVTSTFPPFMPALVRCDGDAIIHGTLQARVPTFFSGFPAGRVTIGRGQSGSYCASGAFFAPQGGQHAGTYGSVFPFALEGGSPGGDLVTYGGQFIPCATFLSRDSGTEGGGTIALLAGGRIEVGGTVDASGASTSGNYAAGSGGSILLRGAGGVIVLPTGRVTAMGGQATQRQSPYPPDYSRGAPGYVRIDSWGAPPALLGTITPAPTVVELPHLRTQSTPSLGSTWTFDTFAPEASAIFAAASAIQGTGTPTPFGSLGIDLPSAMILVYGAIAPADHDPFVNVPTPVPNSPTLVGINFWVQAFVAPPGLPPRFSNTLAVTVQ